MTAKDVFLGLIHLTLFILILGYAALSMFNAALSFIDNTAISIKRVFGLVGC